MNPELRQTLNAISRNFESANETAQENIYTFTQLVIDPCLAGIKSCMADCSVACFPTREDKLRRKRARSRGRSDLHFDFYDDWDDDEEAGYVGSSWGNDELDSLLAGRASRNGQPGRQRAMSYGARGRRKPQSQGEEDPNLIPSSSYLGFLERFPWRLGKRGIRYKPSAADLQEHPGRLRIGEHEHEPLLESDRENDDDGRKGHARNRSDTDASKSTTNSLSSRGDLIIGDEEDDAIPIDDEFAVMLSRQVTRESSKRPGASRKSTRSQSTRSIKTVDGKRAISSRYQAAVAPPPILEQHDVEPPTIQDLHSEEQSLEHEQELEIAQKRHIASQLAKSKGLTADATSTVETIESKSSGDEPAVTSTTTALPQMDMTGSSPTQDLELSDNRPPLASPLSSNQDYHGDEETEPFPSLPTTPSKEIQDPNHPP